MQTEDKNGATTSRHVAHQVFIEPHDELNVRVMFKDKEYEGQWLEIGNFLKTQQVNPSWSKKQLNEFRRRAFNFSNMKGIYEDIQRSQPKILFKSFVRMILREN